MKLSALTIGLLLAAATSVQADGLPRQVPPAAVTHECGACHVVFPPGALPAASWQRLTGGLDRHFGTDASIDDPAVRTAVRDWLVAHAATGQRARAEPPQDRITRAAWFVREHADIPAATWQRPAIRSAANCGACHGGAAQGRFDEHDVRIPR